MGISAARGPVDILLVEDNPADVRLTSEALKRCSPMTKLHVAGDGEEALNFLYRRGNFADAPCPDLILLDLNMPKKNGREVLAEIKQDESLRRIPVVVLTTSDAEEDILCCYNLHANCYITKPFEFSEFIQVIKSIEDFWFSIAKLPKKER